MWQWLLFLGYFGLLVILITRVSFFRFKELPSWTALSLFLAKVAAGFALFYIYTYYYTDHEHSDTWKYFDDAHLIYSWSSSRPEVFWKFVWGVDLFSPDMQPYVDQLHGWTNPYTYGLSHDSPTIVRINLAMMFLSGGFYPIHILFMCFLSLAGLKALHQLFEVHLPLPKWWLVVALFLAPSVLFWSSGVLKEAPLIAALGFLWWSYDQLLFGKRTISLMLVFLFSVFIMYWLKEYVLLCCAPALFFMIAMKVFSRVKKVYLFLLSQFVVMLFALFPGPFFSAGNIVYVLNKKQNDFYNVSREMKAGSLVEIAPLANNGDLFFHFPQAFGMTFFRPFIWEANGIVGLFSAIENTIYLLLFLLALFSLRKIKELPTLWWACFSVVIFSAIIIGNAVPVLGAVVRYKIAALPFFLVCCLWLIASSRMKLSFGQQSSQ